jgi:hypothetical protein
MADVNITIGATLDQLVSGVTAAKSALQELTTGAKTLVGAFAIREMDEFVKSMAELGEQAERTASILGISTVAAQELGQIAALSGSSAEALTTSLTRMTVGLERGQAATSVQAAALRALGLSAQQMLAASPDKQINMIADAVKRLGDQGINAAPALAMLSRGLASMTPMLREGSAAVDQWRQRLIDAGAIVDEQTTKNLVALDRELKVLDGSFKGLGETIVSAMTPSLIELSKELGSAMANLAGLIRTGNLGNYVLQYAALYWDYLKAKIAGTTEEVEKANQALQDLNKTFENLAKGVGAGLGGAAMTPVRVAVETGKAMSDAIKVADDAFREHAEIIKQLADTFQITELQKTQLLIVEINKRKAAEIKAGEDVKVAMAKANADIQKEVTSLTKKISDDWKSAADSIAASFNSQIRGLLAGTITFGQAMKNVFADMVVDLIGSIVKLAVEWAVQQVFMATVGRAMAAQAAASFVSRLAADAALVFGGVFANLAPTMGPAAAGPAAISQASVLAELANIPKFEQGTPFVANTGLALVHQGEAIIPSWANPAAGSAPTSVSNTFGGNTLHVHVNAIDASSFASMLMDNQSALSNALRNLARRSPNAFANFAAPA